MSNLKAGDAATLLASAEAFRILSDALPARATARQVLAIMRVFAANAAGESITIGDLREFTPDEQVGTASIGQTIARTFSIFYEPNHKFPERLGWVTREIDPEDERKKYLRLTPAGQEVAARVAETIRKGAK